MGDISVPMSSAEHKLSLISRHAIEGTPMELLVASLVQHYEEDRELRKTVAMLDKRLDPEAEEYVLKPLIPYMQGAAGLGILWKLFITVGAGLLIWAQIKQTLGK